MARALVRDRNTAVDDARPKCFQFSLQLVRHKAIHVVERRQINTAVFQRADQQPAFEIALHRVLDHLTYGRIHALGDRGQIDMLTLGIGEVKIRIDADDLQLLDTQLVGQA